MVDNLQDDLLLDDEESLPPLTAERERGGILSSRGLRGVGAALSDIGGLAINLGRSGLPGPRAPTNASARLGESFAQEDASSARLDVLRKQVETQAEQFRAKQKLAEQKFEQDKMESFSSKVKEFATATPEQRQILGAGLGAYLIGSDAAKTDEGKEVVELLRKASDDQISAITSSLEGEGFTKEKVQALGIEKVKSFLLENMKIGARKEATLEVQGERLQSVESEGAANRQSEERIAGARIRSSEKQNVLNRRLKKSIASAKAKAASGKPLSTDELFALSVQSKIADGTIQIEEGMELIENLKGRANPFAALAALQGGDVTQPKSSGDIVRRGQKRKQSREADKKVRETTSALEKSISGASDKTSAIRRAIELNAQNPNLVDMDAIRKKFPKEFEALELQSVGDQVFEGR